MKSRYKRRKYSSDSDSDYDSHHSSSESDTQSDGKKLRMSKDARKLIRTFPKLPEGVSRDNNAQAKSMAARESNLIKIKKLQTSVAKTLGDKEARAKWTAEETTSRLNKVERQSTGVLKELHKQSKDLLIASIAGWSTVDVYNGPEGLTSDDMRRVEHSAKLASKVLGRGESRGVSHNRQQFFPPQQFMPPQQFFPPQQYAPQQYAPQQYPPQQYAQQQQIEYPGNRALALPPPPPRVNTGQTFNDGRRYPYDNSRGQGWNGGRQASACTTCGEMGHTAWTCPKNKRS
jgi:hypothetical protein